MQCVPCIPIQGTEVVLIQKTQKTLAFHEKHEEVKLVGVYTKMKHFEIIRKWCKKIEIEIFDK